jgi:hypothetical protein
MGRLEREKATLKAMIEARKNRRTTYPDYPEGIERNAFCISEFFRVRYEDPYPTDKDDDGPPPSYEDCLAWAIRDALDPEYRARQRLKRPGGIPMLWDRTKLGLETDDDLYEWCLAEELKEQPQHDADLNALSFDPIEWLRAYEAKGSKPRHKPWDA